MGPLLLLFMSSGRGSGGKIPNQQGTDDGEKCESNCGAKTLFVAHVKWLHCGPDRPGCRKHTWRLRHISRYFIFEQVARFSQLFHFIMTAPLSGQSGLLESRPKSGVYSGSCPATIDSYH
jgi:hypothetical protein